MKKDFILSTEKKIFGFRDEISIKEIKHVGMVEQLYIREPVEY